MVAPLSYGPWTFFFRALHKWSFALFVTLALFVCSEPGYSQNLRNSGQIDNTGMIRLKGQAMGLPPSVGGVMEFFGGNQVIPPRQYMHLTLSGSGTKTSDSSFSVSGNLTIAPVVTLATQSGATITLIGNLIEQGYLSGSINKTVDLSGSATSSNFGNIGADIAWTGQSPGITTVTRTSGKVSTGNGNQSVLRYYDIAPTFGSSLNGSFTYRYTANELNGLDVNALELWRSIDGGVTWRRQGGTNLPGFSAIVKTGIVSFSRWTASDTSKLLGPPAYEWVASNLASTSGDGQSAPTGTVLAPYIVTVTDFYGNPISGVSVNFVVDSIPGGATGYSLSTTSTTTDVNGRASTSLTLGNTAGIYKVRAISGGLTGSPRTFSATATVAAASMTLLSGNNQVDSIRATLAPFQVQVNDAAGNSVAGVSVDFAITGKPAGESGSAISNSSSTTNGLGIATTVLRLGNKVGSYSVRATTAALPGVEVNFSSVAVNGAAAVLAPLQGTATQQDTILNTLDSLFIVRVADGGGNAVPNAAVQFAIIGMPAAAVGQSLSATFVTTDSSGQASTRLTLGSKVGMYQVTATSGSLTGSPLTFTAQAQAGPPAFLADPIGSGQQKPVATVLDTAFAIRVIDVGGNPIAGVTVQFRISSIPLGASGYAVSASADSTDVNGEASTVLTLGTKSGRYIVTASSPAIPGDSTSFNALARSGAAARILAASGSGQSDATGSVLAQPFVVTVTDAFGNPVQGATVQFAVSSVPSGATGDSLTATSAATDSLGQARTSLRLGDLPGNYITTATVSGLAAVQFSATAIFVLADVNRDFDVNIADLTTMIDHILGKITLAGSNFARADVNRDASVDLRDAIIVRDSLLGLATLGGEAVGKAETTDPSGLNGLLASERSANTTAQSINGTLELSPQGLRFDLINDVPVKGLQLIVMMKNDVTLQGPVVKFARAGVDTVIVNFVGREMRVVMYNFDNSPIASGSGTLFRLPIKLADTSDIVAGQLIASTNDTSVVVGDIATQVPLTATKAPTGKYPDSYALYQNYPNPFNPNTTIEYDVPEAAAKIPRVAIQVFNILGQQIRTLDRGEKDAGHYKAVWDGRDEYGMRVPSGVYIYRLLSEDFVVSKRMVLIK